MTSKQVRTIRRAKVEDSIMLGELTERSSTHWGYPPGFFDWAPEASVISEEYVRDNPVYLLEEDPRRVGFCGFTEEKGEFLLDKLFVDIDRIGTGCGTALWFHAENLARRVGRTYFVIGSDPNAAAFYKAMGAIW